MQSNSMFAIFIVALIVMNVCAYLCGLSKGKKIRKTLTEDLPAAVMAQESTPADEAHLSKLHELAAKAAEAGNISLNVSVWRHTKKDEKIRVNVEQKLSEVESRDITIFSSSLERSCAYVIERIEKWV